MTTSLATDYCYIIRAEDGDVAVMISTEAFDAQDPIDLALDTRGMSMQQSGARVLECPLPEQWAIEALRAAPRIVAVNVKAPGRLDEEYVINESVRLVEPA